MRRNIIRAATAVLLTVAMFSFSACFEETYPAPAPYPAYSYAPGYSYGAPPVVVGDYDEHHVWHDRGWWVGHDRPWVESHHHEWLEHHDRDDRDRD